jgi:tripartite-type tricarboxylate transporter receptor subunit TctC
VTVWHGLYAPKSTPKPVIDKLTNALEDALKDSNVKQRFGELGAEPVSLDRATPQALQKHNQKGRRLRRLMKGIVRDRRSIGRLQCRFFFLGSCCTRRSYSRTV